MRKVIQKDFWQGIIIGIAANAVFNAITWLVQHVRISVV